MDTLGQLYLRPFVFAALLYANLQSDRLVLIASIADWADFVFSRLGLTYLTKTWIILSEGIGELRSIRAAMMVGALVGSWVNGGKSRTTHVGERGQ